MSNQTQEAAGPVNAARQAARIKQLEDTVSDVAAHALAIAAASTALADLQTRVTDLEEA